ncbi:MAG TPA: ATP-binding protein [Anaerolineales bacterium]|nr:ATP-binding protein [Anaerolineales bacterium]
MSEPVSSLTQLLDRASSRRFLEAPLTEELGLAEELPFPFLAIVGQPEMKLALLLGLINPNVDGVLLIGTRGTGKTTAVRSLAGLLPEVARSLCAYGCLPEDIEGGGLDEVCPDCARKYGEGQSLTYRDRVQLIELPLNSGLDDVIGGIDEHSPMPRRMRLRRGILARADRNLLYVDEVNLLSDEIVDSILDAAAQGSYTVRRGGTAASYRSRFVLIGSMNPEEGRLRPQILDRFGLRVLVRGLQSKPLRLEGYRRAISFRGNPRQVIREYAHSTESVRTELQTAREALPKVELSRQAERFGLGLIKQLGIDSLRAEITLFEAARAHAVADGRLLASPKDVRAVAPMAIRLRRSEFMKDFFRSQRKEQQELDRLLKSPTTRHNSR